MTAASFDIPGPNESTPAGTVGAPTGHPADGASLRLDAAARGQVVRVVAVDGDDAISERLAACGVWAGTEIECLAAAPFGGPLLFRIHGYRLALRRTEAARVLVASPDGSGAAA